MSDQTENKDEWIEAGAMEGEVWTPEKEGDIIQGQYVGVETGVGVNKSNLYSLKEENKDEPTKVWGSKVLDAKFAEIEVGNMVQIEYLGREKGDKPQPYKNYRVMYKPFQPFKG
jgi:hypothetical protein